jgi:hypothetical protein
VLGREHEIAAGLQRAMQHRVEPRGVLDVVERERAVGEVECPGGQLEPLEVGAS